MGHRVLVVDDDASFRALSSRILRCWGHTVVGEAATVAEALARADDLRPDTVVADIGLPDGDGFDLTRRLLGMPRRPRVVLVSSDADPANGPAAMRVGACAFFPKDQVTGAELRRLLERG
jgi:CheY-like chemotaxis protein